MSWWPKRLLQWKEPRTFLREKDQVEDAGLRWWYKALAVVGLSVVTWGNAVTGKMNRSGDWSALMLPVGVVLGIFAGMTIFVYGSPWLIRRFPGYVTLTEEWISLARGNRSRYLKLAQIATFSWEIRENFQILTLVPREGKRELRIGVPADVSRETIHQQLVRHGAMPALPSDVHRASGNPAFAPG